MWCCTLAPIVVHLVNHGRPTLDWWHATIDQSSHCFRAQVGHCWHTVRMWSSHHSVSTVPMHFWIILRCTSTVWCASCWCLARNRTFRTLLSVANLPRANSIVRTAVECPPSSGTQHSTIVQKMLECCQTLIAHIRSGRTQCWEMTEQNRRHAVQFLMTPPVISAHIDFYPTPYANNPISAGNFVRPKRFSIALLLVFH